MKKLTTEEFISKAKEVHGDKYDYSKVEYKNNKTNVCIICPIHGEFWQRPDKHLNRHDGCVSCSYKERGIKFRSNTNKFVEECTKIHNGKYDYSKVIYTKSNDRVCISCPIHGEFWQIANDHKRGCGCPKCKQSVLEREILNRLNKECIPYIYQCNHTVFPWLKRKTLDFYLPTKSIAIECQGRQHYQAIDFFGGEDGFKNNIERDNIKKELCEINGIILKYYATDLRIKRDNTFFDDIDDLFNFIKNG